MQDETVAIKNTLPAIAMLLDDHRGIYIPRDFVQDFDLTRWKGIDQDDIDVCLDPEHEYYWDAWQDILDNATFTENGFTWVLYQDGAVWALCPELMDNEERKNFGYDEIED